MGNLDNESIHSDIPAKRHKVLQWYDEPSKDVCGSDVGKQRIRLDHRYGVDSEEKLVLLVRVLDNCHEGIRQNGDQNRNDEEVADEEEQG